MKTPMTLRDLRWKLAFWVWCPAAWVEERCHGAATGDRVVLVIGWVDGEPIVTERRYVAFPPPLRYRILRRLIADPLSWLSDRIYPLWFEDERTRLDYWRRG